MAATSSPYGLKPINLIGGQAFNGGVIRDIVLSDNVATAFYTGAVIVLDANGNPSAITASPTGMDIPNAADADAGILGVCLGVQYTDPTLGYSLWGQYLPANALNNGYSNVLIRVCDDPDQLYQIQGTAAFGTLTNGPAPTSLLSSTWVCIRTPIRLVYKEILNGYFTFATTKGTPPRA